jgi:Acetokinase family
LRAWLNNHLLGLPMGTRCGDLNPAVVLYLMQEKGLSPTAISDLLYHSSGLLGVSGISDDMRTLLASNDPHATEAVDLLVYRIDRERACSRRRSAGWTPSCSRPALANTRRTSGAACCARQLGSELRMRQRMSARCSRLRTARFRLGSFRPMKI